MDQFIIGNVPEPEGYEARDLHKKRMAKDNKMIVYIIKDHHIPDVSTFNTLKEVYDDLEKMFEGRNINQKMNLSNQ